MFAQPQLNECDVLYTVQKVKKGSLDFYGPVHGTDDIGETVCGMTIDDNWYVLTNDYDGHITCKKCIDHHNGVS